MIEEQFSKKEDDIFYQELHSASRSYDVKLWAIPGLFFAVAGLIVGNLNFETFFVIKNLLILFFGVIFLSILLLQFYKTHFFNLSIQKKIDKFDLMFDKNKNKDNELKRMPLESMPDKVLNERIKELEEDMDKPFGNLPKFLIRQRITDWMKTGMFICLIFVMFCFIVCLSEILSKHIC